MNRTSEDTLRVPIPAQSAVHQQPGLSLVSKERVASAALQRLQSVARELYEFELYREATDLFRYLTLIDPSNPTHWYWLGRSLVSVGDPYAAAQVFELGSRLSHAAQFVRLAADAWLRAGYPDRAEAVRVTEGGSS